VIGQNAAFSGHPPLAARLVASRPARCESPSQSTHCYLGLGISRRSFPSLERGDVRSSCVRTARGPLVHSVRASDSESTR